MLNEETTKKLKDYGIALEEALDRFLDDDELYITFLGKFLKDKSYADLVASLADNNVEDSFMHAHTLKGVAANLGINPLYKVTSDLVEDLRVGNADNADIKMKKITAEYNKACDMIRSL